MGATQEHSPIQFKSVCSAVDMPDNASHAVIVKGICASSHTAPMRASSAGELLNGTTAA